MQLECIRQGTANFARGLLVPSGQVRDWGLNTKDSEHLCPVLKLWSNERLSHFDKIHWI